MKKTILLLSVILLALSCDNSDDNLTPTGINTNIYGEIKSPNNEAISNLIIKIGEYELGGGSYPWVINDSYHLEFVQYIDSTYTDNEGKYDFVFTTSGRGNYYKMFVGKQISKNEPQIIWEPYAFDLTRFENDTTVIGKEFEHNYNYMSKLYPCEITLQFNDTQYFPVKLYHDTTYSFNLSEIDSNETIIRTIYIDKYNSQTFELYRTKPNGAKQKATYTFPESNVENLTTQNIMVNEEDFIDI